MGTFIPATAFILVQFFFTSVKSQQSNSLTLALLPITYDGSYVTSLNFSHVIALALEDIVSAGNILPGYTLNQRAYGDECGKSTLIENIVDQAVADGSNVLLTPRSTISGTSISEMATERQLALIDCFKYTVTAEEEHHEEEEEEEEIPTTSSVISNYLKISYGIEAVVAQFGWKKVSIGQSSVHEHNGFDMLTMGEQLEVLMRADNISVETKDAFSEAAGRAGYERTLRRLSAKSRSKLKT